MDWGSKEGWGQLHWGNSRGGITVGGTLSSIK